MGFEIISISGSTDGAADDVNTTNAVEFCGYGTWPGPDLIYSIKPTVNGTLKATLIAAYANHYLHIRKVCPGTNSNEIGCDYGATTAEIDASTVPVTTGGVLHVIVDGYGSIGGQFTLQLQIQ